MPHDGWRLFLPYLIDTYKNNISTVTTEGVQAWYRLTPSAACGNGGTTGNTISQEQCEVDPATVAQDKIFYSALLGSSADVTVSIGGNVQTGTWDDSPVGGIGIYHGSVDFNGYTGDVIVTISRSGSTVASMSGEAITDSCTNDITNWNAWTGSASASTSISATPLS